MVLTSLFVIFISVLGFVHMNSSKYEKMRTKRLSPGALTINLLAYGSLHLSIGVFIAVVVSMIALLFPLKPVPTWLLSFSGLALDFQLPLAGIVIAFCALVSAIFSGHFTREQRRKSSLSDVAIAMELVESEIEQSFIDALVMANLGVDGKDSADLLFRVVMRNRKVYIGNLTQYDIIRGHSRSIVLQPIFSGYQQESTLELELTDHYGVHYKRLAESALEEDIQSILGQFSITIPVSEIVATSMFKMQSYIEFIKAKNKDVVPTSP